MNWDDFINQRKVKRARIDKQKAKSLVAMSNEILNLFDNIVISDKNASSIASNYYEALREIIEAISLLRGWNVYSHEAFTIFLSELLNESRTAMVFDRMRKVRNRINYYGKKVSAIESEQNKKETHKLIKELKKKYLGEL